MSGEVTITLSLIATVIAICGTVYGIFSNRKKNVQSDREENRNDGMQVGQILSELGYIKGQIDEVKAKQDKMDDRYIKFTEQIAALTAYKSESEHNFDDIYDKIDKINDKIDHFHSD